MDVLPTPLWADACVRLGIPVRAVGGLQPVGPAGPVIGRVLPARHAGSVDVFFEALERAKRGDVLVVDNGGRLDEGCVGDLTALECQGAGLAALFVWGAHRDTADLRAIGFPVWSLGHRPNGPLEMRPRHPEALSSAVVDAHQVSAVDLVVLDADGAVFLPAARFDEISAAAQAISRAERNQAALAASGTSLRAQFGFGTFLAARKGEPGLTFREHLRRRGGAIEE